MDQIVELHRRASDGLLTTARAAAGKWDLPSPCTEWDARGVVEHVIGFHEVLILKPLGVRVERPRDDPAARWQVTAEALASVLAGEGALDASVEVPGGRATELRQLVPTLTTDVLVHTWDLARAVGAPDVLDPELCEIAYARASKNRDALRGSSMFGDEVKVPDDAPLQDRMLGLFGRDPGWRPTSA